MRPSKPAETSWKLLIPGSTLKKPKPALANTFTMCEDQSDRNTNAGLTLWTKAPCRPVDADTA